MQRHQSSSYKHENRSALKLILRCSFFTSTDVVKDVDKNKENRPADEKRPALPYHCGLPHCHIQTSDIPLKLQNLIDRREKPADSTPYLCVVGNTSHMPRVNKTVKDKKVFCLTRWKQHELDQKQKPPAASTPQLQLPITCLTVTWAVTSSHTQVQVQKFVRHSASHIIAF